MAVCLPLASPWAACFPNRSLICCSRTRCPRHWWALTLAGGTGAYSFGGLATENTPITHISAALSLTTVTELAGIALVLTAAAGAVSAACAMKYEPCASCASGTDKGENHMAVLSLKDVGYTYEKTTKPVFRGLSADFEAGRVYCIVGKSGAGQNLPALPVGRFGHLHGGDDPV